MPTVKPTLNIQHEYITLKMPNGNFTVSYRGCKATGGIVNAGAGVFQRFVNFVENKENGESYGERMEKLTDTTILTSIWSDWNKVEKNPFKINDEVTVPKKPQFGFGTIYKITKKSCYVLFKREGRIVFPFTMLKKVE